MEKTKTVFQSKIVWLGIIETLIGSGQLLAEYLNAGDFSEIAITHLVIGMLTIVSRIWFTNTTIK